MSAGTCNNCGKNIEKYLNFCDGDCVILSARRNGGKVM